MRLALSLTAALCALTASAAPFPSAHVPLLAYSSPSPFLGLEDGFSTPIGTVAFIPGFHTCGTLNIFSVDPELEFEDFERLKERTGEGKEDAEEGLWQRYESGQSGVIEDNAVEGTILAWAAGWRKTCGRGAENKEVRVTKVLVDGADARSDREGWVASLDAHLKLLLDDLRPAPHNNVILVTSLSPSTLLRLFDLASPPPSSPSPSNPNTGKPMPSRRRRHGLIYRLISHFISLILWVGLAIALYLGGKKLWTRVQEKRELLNGGGGQVRLPTTREEERELEFELGSEEGEGADELPSGAVELERQLQRQGPESGR
ncbi:hypothetical protein JCM11641_001651 [Rhodosporidiobolus odoratus]